MRVLCGCETKAALLCLKSKEAGQQALGDLQVIAVEPGGGLSDVTELVGQFLLCDGVQLRLVALQRVKLVKKRRSRSVQTSEFACYLKKYIFYYFIFLF